MKILYPDTNIFLDYLLSRKNVFGKDISIPAAKLFYRAIKCEFYIAISSWTLQELFKEMDITQAKMLFTFAEKKIVKVTHSEEDISKAKEICPDHFQDALHGLLAAKAKADLVITRNLSDFACVNHLVKAELPENV